MNRHILSRWIALSVLIGGLAACAAPIAPSPTPTAFASARTSESPTAPSPTPTAFVSARTSESPTIVATDDKALQLKSDDAAGYYDRGSAYAKKGDYDKAIADYDKAIQLKPDDVQAYFNRGMVYKRNDARERAIADFKKVLELTDDQNVRKQAEDQLKALGAQ